MSRPLALFAIGLAFGGGIGFLTALSTGAELEGHAHGAHGGHGDDHGNHDVAAGCDGHDAGHNDHADHGDTKEVSGPAPTLAIMVTEDPVSGWNLRLITENFRFAPAHSGCADSPGEGHAHLYVNGEKRARLYGHWAHIAELPATGATVSVTLNANGHSPLAVNGVTVEATAKVPPRD